MAAASYRYYFAYLGNSEAYNSSTHARDDEEIFSLSIDQEEDEAAGATVSITYREGSYTALGRRAAISCRKINQDTGTLTGPVIPLIVGRITAAPIGLIGEVVELEIVAKADNWEDQLVDLIAPYTSSSVAYFDPLFYEVGANRDAASVLAARGKTVAWDRITGAPRLSDLISGPRTLTMTRVARDGVSHQVEEPPLRSLEIEVTASWQQDASVLSTVRWQHGTYLDVIQHQAVQQAWPKPGQDLGGEWIVADSELSWNKPKMVKLGEIAGGYDSAIYSGDVPVYRSKSTLVVLKNNRRQARTEVARVQLSANVQELMSPGNEIRSFSLRRVIGSGDSVDPWQPTASYAAGDVVFYFGKLYECRLDHVATYKFAASLWAGLEDEFGRFAESYFQTSRGAQSLAYAVNLAAASLKKSSRVARIGFSVPLEDAIDVEIDDMISVTAPGIPGGSATGKLVSYTLNAEGWADLEIACCVGRGGSSTPNSVSVSGSAPKLGPRTYPSTGRVSPIASVQIAALREAPDAYTLEARVEIDAPAVPSTFELRRDVALNAGTMSIPEGVSVE